MIHAAFGESVQRLRTSWQAPRELSALWWSSSMLGVESPMLYRTLSLQASSQISRFQLGDLILLACGASSFMPCSGTLRDAASIRENVQVLATLQEEMLRRVVLFASDSGESNHHLSSEASAYFFRTVRVILWFSHFAGQLRNYFRTTACHMLKRSGQLMDLSQGAGLANALINHNARTETARDWACCQPLLVLDLPDRQVIHKPPNWEVYDQHTDMQLLSWLQVVMESGWQLMRDSKHQFGFLHRLDVPSSGLIVTAKSFEAYYDLRTQLAVGDVVREYAVLCHGWIPSSLHEIDSCVYWRPEELNTQATTAGQGKPSSTHLKARIHTMAGLAASSIASVMIRTGRRHQIRSHFSHVGYPTWSDGKYTPPITMYSDHDLSTRNCLHRYRVTFKDSGGKRREAAVALSPDLSAAWAELSPKVASRGAIHIWLVTNFPSA